VSAVSAGPDPAAGGPAPTDEATVLSAGWLTAVLRPRHPAATVAGTEVTERLETVATKVRFRLQYSAGGGGDGLPPALCAKGYFNPAMRGRAAATEAVFYRELAPTLDGVRTPPCIHAGVDDATGHGLVLMEDLVEAGATFLDPRSSYRPEEAAATLDQLAALHAVHWERPGATLPGAFAPRLELLSGILPTDRLQAQLDDGRAPDVPADVRRADRVQGAVRALAALASDHPRCVVHGDVHTGNVYQLADGRPGLIDWQVVQQGVWALDVAYHLATVLDPDDRERAERDLLDHYLDRLAAHGVVPPERDAAWWLYRAHLPYGFFMWGITRMVDRPVIEHLTRRLGLAVAAHRSLDLLDV
jgi:aminoglycoside phosphotransferase (APT) family kinase protein